MFSEVVCGGLEDGKGSEVSMKGSAMKASMSEMVSLGEERDERVGVKIFLAAAVGRKVLVIKENIKGFGGETQERRLVFEYDMDQG